MTFVRSFRASLTIAVLWSLLWLPVGVAVGIYGSLHGAGGWQSTRTEAALSITALWVLWGGVSGLAFALIVVAVGRRGARVITSVSGI